MDAQSNSAGIARGTTLKDDLEEGLQCSHAAFGQLAALLCIAKDMAPNHSQLRKLLELGWHTACDMENHVCCILDQLPSEEVPE